MLCKVLEISGSDRLLLVVVVVVCRPRTSLVLSYYRCAAYVL